MKSDCGGGLIAASNALLLLENFEVLGK